MVASDINGDAKPDIITANSGTNGAGGNTVHINITPNGAAAPTFSGPTAFSAGNTPYSVTASDVNADGGRLIGATRARRGGRHTGADPRSRCRP